MVSTRRPGQGLGAGGNDADLRAVLDQEHKHSQLLLNAGATSVYTEFHFPVLTLRAAGSLGHRGSFLWTVDHLVPPQLSVIMRRPRQEGLWAVGHGA